MVQTIKGPAIPTEWIERIRADVIKSARYQNICRQVTGVRVIGNSLGIQTWIYDKVSEVSDAELSWALTEIGEDVIGRSRASINIPVIHKEFKVNARDLEVARNNGFPIDTHTAESAAYKVTHLENQIVMSGYSADGTTYEVNGLYKSAGNTYSGAADFATAGKAMSAVSGAIELMMEDLMMPPYNLVLNPAQYVQLSASILGSGAGADEMPKVEKMLGGGRIIVTPYQDAGTGMLLTAPGNGNHHELLIAKDMSVKTLLEPKTEDLWGRVFEAVVPIVYDANSICKLTTI